MRLRLLGIRNGCVASNRHFLIGRCGLLRLSLHCKLGLCQLLLALCVLGMCCGILLLLMVMLSESLLIRELRFLLLCELLLQELLLQLLLSLLLISLNVCLLLLLLGRRETLRVRSYFRLLLASQGQIPRVVRKVRHALCKHLLLLLRCFLSDSATGSRASSLSDDIGHSSIVRSCSKCSKILLACSRAPSKVRAICTERRRGGSGHWSTRNMLRRIRSVSPLCF